MLFLKSNFLLAQVCTSIFTKFWVTKVTHSDILMFYAKLSWVDWHSAFLDQQKWKMIGDHITNDSPLKTVWLRGNMVFTWLTTQKKECFAFCLVGLVTTFTFPAETTMRLFNASGYIGGSNHNDTHLLLEEVRIINGTACCWLAERYLYEQSWSGCTFLISRRRWWLV